MLRRFPVGDVEGEFDRRAFIQHPAGEQAPPAGAVLAQVLLLEWRPLASRLQFFKGAQRSWHPLGRREFVPTQETGLQVLAREAGHAQKGSVAVGDTALGVEENHPHSLDLGDAPEPLLALAEPRFALPQVRVDAKAVYGRG